MVVYLDVVMGLNFLVDLLLLISADRLAGYKSRWSRLTAGAAFGALYAASCFVPGFSFMGNDLWRVVSLMIMGLISFGVNHSAIQRGAVFLLLSMAMGGAATAIRVNNYITLVACGGLIWLLCRLSFRGAVGEREYIEVEMCFEGRCVRTYALKDTGNTLRDSITGEQVLVADSQIGATLLNVPEEMLCRPVDLLLSGKISGLRLIPYHSVGQAEGMLPMVRIRNIKIGGTYSDALVAFAPERIGRGEVYQMLTGGAI